jgi:hypothetical protein
MKRQGWVEFDDDAGVLTTTGETFLARHGIDLDRASEKKRRTRALPLCGLCLDWSERRQHFSGRLGSELCRHSLLSGWVRKRQGSPALDVTLEGKRVFRDVFQVQAYREADIELDLAG